MELIKVNHVITGVRAILNNLVDTDVIDDQDRRNLLTMIVKEVIKNDSIKMDLS